MPGLEKPKLHNKMHNMDDDTMPLPTHVTWRGTTLQYVRRVPDDVAPRFGRTRIQRSLRTRDPLVARAKALELDYTFEKRFQEVRAALGPIDPVIGTETWTLADWEKLAEWFKTKRIEEDTLRRATVAVGGDLTRRPNNVPFDDRVGGVFHTEITTLKAASRLTSAEWYAARGEAVRRSVAALGVVLSETLPQWPLISLALQRADRDAAEIIMDRERGTSRPWPSPDQVEGPWRRTPDAVELGTSVAATQTALSQQPAVTRPVTSAPIRTLLDVQDAWSAGRVRNNQSVDERGQAERRRSIERFSAHSGKTNIAELERCDLIAYRDWRHDEQDAAPATANKEISVISSLLKHAKGRNWISAFDLDGLHLETPKGDDDIEPFSEADLATIFGCPLYRALEFDSAVKACGALQYWLPIISVSHGMISSEIMQLSAETVGPHPDHPDIFCFNVTTANGRRAKTLARRRYVPIHRRMIDLGLMDVVAAARADKQQFLWSEVDALGVKSASNFFSAWFSTRLRKKLDITDPKKRLYSCRHSFKDRLKKMGVMKEHRDMLMGHAETGSGARYGTKRDPEPVPISLLNEFIQKQPLAFLNDVARYKAN